MPAGANWPFVLLAVGMLSGCQLEPAIEFLPPVITYPPVATSEPQPEFAGITTREFSLTTRQQHRWQSCRDQYTGWRHLARHCPAFRPGL